MEGSVVVERLSGDGCLLMDWKGLTTKFYREPMEHTDEVKHARTRKW